MHCHTALDAACRPRSFVDQYSHSHELGGTDRHVHPLTIHGLDRNQSPLVASSSCNTMTMTGLILSLSSSPFVDGPARIGLSARQSRGLILKLHTSVGEFRSPPYHGVVGLQIHNVLPPRLEKWKCWWQQCFIPQRRPFCRCSACGPSLVASHKYCCTFGGKFKFKFARVHALHVRPPLRVAKGVRECASFTSASPVSHPGLH